MGKSKNQKGTQKGHANARANGAVWVTVFYNTTYTHHLNTFRNNGNGIDPVEECKLMPISDINNKMVTGSIPLATGSIPLLCALCR